MYVQNKTTIQLPPIVLDGETLTGYVEIDGKMYEVFMKEFNE